MPEHSSLHFYLNWTKQRIDEMDAALASLEAADRVRAELKVRPSNWSRIEEAARRVSGHSQETG